MKFDESYETEPKIKTKITVWLQKKVYYSKEL